MRTNPEIPILGVVGPCGSGKSTLIKQLERYNLPIRHIAQEHSFVQTMWQKIAHAEILIFLDATFPVSTHRRQLNWNEADYLEQHRRLAHARQHADLYILTDDLSPTEIADRVLFFLREQDYPFPLPPE